MRGRALSKLTACDVSRLRKQIGHAEALVSHDSRLAEKHRQWAHQIESHLGRGAHFISLWRHALLLLHSLRYLFGWWWLQRSGNGG